MDHGEEVSSLCFNEKGDRLASTGMTALKIWNVTSGRQLRCILIPFGIKGMSLRFSTDERFITMASDRHQVMTVTLDDDESIWQHADAALTRMPEEDE